MNLEAAAAKSEGKNPESICRYWVIALAIRRDGCRFLGPQVLVGFQGRKGGKRMEGLEVSGCFGLFSGKTGAPCIYGCIGRSGSISVADRFFFVAYPIYPSEFPMIQCV